MLQKLKFEYKLLVSAQAGTLALFENAEPARVQLWAVDGDGNITGVGVYQGCLAALNLLPDFAGYR